MAITLKKHKLAKTEFNRALHLFPVKKSGWQPTATTCSALTQEGIHEVWKTIIEYLKLTKDNQYFQEKRKEQNQYWMMETINEQLKTNFYNHPEIITDLIKTKKQCKMMKYHPLQLLLFYWKNILKNNLSSS